MTLNGQIKVVPTNIAFIKKEGLLVQVGRIN
jgi:hypothetical protein